MSYVYIEGTVKYARCFEFNKDNGENLPVGSDIRNKIEADQGHYVAEFYPDDPELGKGHAALKKAGIPDKGMLGQLYKTNMDGEEFYKCKRPHFNTKLTDETTGERGVVMGPPKVGCVIDGEWAEWDSKEDGLIGNGSRVKMKFNVWKDRIVNWEGMSIIDHVTYEAPQEAF